MNIKEIEIINFKGFQKEKVSFKNNLTVVIGNNTAGKTTLLKAIQIGLGAYLQSLIHLPRGSQFRRNFSTLDTFKAFDSHNRTYVSNPERPRITIKADYPTSYSIEKDEIFTTPIEWYREYTGSYTTHTKSSAGQLIEIVHSMEQKRFEKHEDTLYPLVLSFGAKRTSDAQGKTTTKIKERASRMEKA